MKVGTGRSATCVGWLVAVLLSACGGQPQSARVSAEEANRAAVRFNFTPGGNIGDTWLAFNENVGLGHPKARGDEVLISRSQYVISWSSSRRQPNWVAWRLTWTDLGFVERAKNFTIDHELDDLLKSYGSRAVKPTDYKGTCMDRGHQIPSGDRTSWPDDNKATFMMSNIIPQSAHLNRVTWEHLEHHSRELVQGTEEAVYIIAGPIFAANPSTIGPDADIPVPSENFKIVMRADAFVGGKLTSKKDAVLASVIMPNTTSTGTDPILDREQACADSHIADELVESPSSAKLANDWSEYSQSVEQIQQKSGLDLSYLL